MVSFGSWVVVVDVAPASTYRKVEQALRDLGFEEVLPCVFTDRWKAPSREALARRLGAAVRGGVGRVLVCRTGRTAPFWVEASTSDEGAPTRKPAVSDTARPHLGRPPP